MTKETGFLLRDCWGQLDIDRNPVSDFWGNLVVDDVQ